MKDSDYSAILSSIDEALAVYDTQPSPPSFASRIYDQLRELRETVARAQRDAAAKDTQRESA